MYTRFCALFPLCPLPMKYCGIFLKWHLQMVCCNCALRASFKYKFLFSAECVYMYENACIRAFVALYSYLLCCWHVASVSTTSMLKIKIHSAVRFVSFLIFFQFLFFFCFELWIAMLVERTPNYFSLIIHFMQFRREKKVEANINEMVCNWIDILWRFIVNDS